MSADLELIVDENSSPFSYSWSGGNESSPWLVGELPQWYRGTTRYPASTATRIGSFTFRFNGTSAAFTGNTPSAASPQNATVRIDNGTSFVINYDDPQPQTYMQWFRTPNLSEGEHTVTISDIYGTAIDYATVRVGNSTSLTGQTIIVDDDSSLIRYSGQWNRSVNMFIPGGLPKGHPYGNATHRSSKPGDTFAFQFSGTSIAVYGIFSWYNLGTLAATYTLDGTPYPSSISVTTSSRSYTENVGDAANHLHFGRENLPSGAHTLVVNITEANNQAFILDCITYKPSFDTLSSMPSVTWNTSDAQKPTASSSGSVSTGAIVGIVIGGLAFGALLIAFVIGLILRRRRKSREQDYLSQDLTLDSSPNPFTPNSPQTQERSSNIPTYTANRPAKLLHHPSLRSDSATDPLSTMNSSGVDEPGPPTYEAISNRTSP